MFDIVVIFRNGIVQSVLTENRSATCRVVDLDHLAKEHGDDEKRVKRIVNPLIKNKRPIDLTYQH